MVLDSRSMGTRLRTAGLGLALTIFVTPTHALAREPDPELEQEPDLYSEVEPDPAPDQHGPYFWWIPVLHTTVGGGSQVKQRLGVVGGDVLAGVALELGDFDVLVLRPMVGWSGWRTTDKPASLRANTFTGRLDFGYVNLDSHFQGITVFGAGRIGTGRGPEDDRAPFRLAGAAVGLTYWFFAGVEAEGGVLGVEFQSNFTHARGEWSTDLRAVLNLNLAYFWSYPWAWTMYR